MKKIHTLHLKDQKLDLKTKKILGHENIAMDYWNYSFFLLLESPTCQTKFNHNFTDE